MTCHFKHNHFTTLAQTTEILRIVKLFIVRGLVESLSNSNTRLPIIASFRGGWFKCKASTQIASKVKVKPPKTGIELAWVTLGLDFLVHPTIMVHPIVVGVSGRMRYIQPTMWNLGACPWRRLLQASLPLLFTFELRIKQHHKSLGSSLLGSSSPQLKL